VPWVITQFLKISIVLYNSSVIYYATLAQGLRHACNFGVYFIKSEYWQTDLYETMHIRLLYDMEFNGNKILISHYKKHIMWATFGQPIYCTSWAEIQSLAVLEFSMGLSVMQDYNSQELRGGNRVPLHLNDTFFTQINHISLFSKQSLSSMWLAVHPAPAQMLPIFEKKVQPRILMENTYEHT
ncbi:hypothetical protein ACJX0J_005618, partial [Zea mays]